MRHIRHISLDVWNTLIEPNPAFASARLNFLAGALDIAPKRLEEVYRRVKDGADNAAEIAGAGLSSADLYGHFMREVGRPYTNWWRLRLGLELLFAKHPPVFYRENVEALRRLQAHGIGLSIASNTNFIRGSCLHEVTLGTWGIAWDFQVFSDEISRAKPHPMFWRIVKERARTHTGVEPHQILHIGDNKICDGGCAGAGINFEHISGPPKLASVLEGILDQAKAA